MKNLSKQQRIRNIIRRMHSMIDPDCPHSQLRMAIFETALKDAVVKNVAKSAQFSAQHHVRNGLDYLQDIGISPEYVHRLIRQHDLSKYFSMETRHA